MSLEVIEKLVVNTRTRIDGIDAIVLAGTDGRSIAASIGDDNPEIMNQASAVAASSLQLARRLADLQGDGALEEIVVRSANGYVIVAPIGDRWVLTALTVRSANIARIQLAFRDLNPELAGHLESQ